MHQCPRCQHFGDKSKMHRNGRRYYHGNCLAEVIVARKTKKAMKEYKRTLVDKIKWSLFHIPAKVKVEI